MDQPAVAETARRRASGDLDHVIYTFRGVRKDGSAVDVEVHGSSMRSGAEVVLISLIMDITERTRAEREVQLLQQELRHQSTHDSLTGLYNRGYLDATIERELVLAQRSGHPVSVIMGDLDHFKRVNDHQGHLAGDEVLRVFAALMKRNARGSDICCRYGGEEFVVVAPNLDNAGALHRAEQLRARLADLRVPFGGSLIAVTASFGVATYPFDGLTGDHLIGVADTAMYAAKASGRNRVMTNTREPRVDRGKIEGVRPG